MDGATELAATLARLGPFKALPAAELDRVTRKLVMHAARPGGIIFHAQDPAEMIWVVRDGLAVLLQQSSGGKSVALDLFQAGELIGCDCCLGEERYAYTAQAVTGVALIGLPCAAFRGWVKTQQAFAQRVLVDCGQRLRASRMMRSLGPEPVERRVVGTIALLAERFGTRLPLTRRAVGDLAGTTTETVIRVLSPLEKRRLLRSRRGLIEVPDLDALKKSLRQS